MANLVQVESNALLAVSSGQAAYTAPTTPIKVALNSAIGTVTAAGTEISGGSYARQTITFSAPSAGGIASNIALTYTNMPAVTITSVDEWDSAGTPVRRWFGALQTNKTTNVGDTVTITATSYSKTLG